MWLFFFVTQYNSSLSSSVPNYRIISLVVAMKSLTEKKCPYIFYRSDRRKNWIIEKKKAKWTISSLFSFTQYTKPTWRCTQNLKTLAPRIGTEKSATEIFIGDKEQWTNKGTDKQYVAVFFFVTQYNSSLSSFVPNFRIISLVVAEKSLTEKCPYKSDRWKKNMWLFFLLHNTTHQYQALYQISES